MLIKPIKIILYLVVFVFSVSTAQAACDQVTISEIHIHGNSMSGLVENGDILPLRLGYYSCYTPSRDDIVLFNPAGNIADIRTTFIKSIRGVPGDAIVIIKKDEDVYHVAINREVIATTYGEAIVLSAKEARLLTGYISDGYIRPGAYLLFGNKVYSRDSVDSRRFGMVGIKALMGKILL